ncbi:MAG TPA: hypothetical protein PKL15_14545, partial [Saprospiraceae bacterium]|nr:hypothetical protein [Saprospiraceae bacterium]
AFLLKMPKSRAIRPSTSAINAIQTIGSIIPKNTVLFLRLGQETASAGISCQICDFSDVSGFFFDQTESAFL